MTVVLTVHVTVSLPDAVAYLRKSQGKFVSIAFVKRSDGSLRFMLCRVGVRKGVKGVGMNYDPEEHGLLPVWDMQKHAWRSVPLEGLVAVKIGGEWHGVVSDAPVAQG